jgi:hypothetical protein
MEIVFSADHLSFFLRRAPRVTLRILADAVEVSSAEGSVRVSCVVSVVQQGNRHVIVGVASDQVRDPAATTLNLFAGQINEGEREALMFEFLQCALRRLPTSGGFVRPVVVVENIDRLSPVLLGSQRDVVRRALERWGAAAVVMAQVSAGNQMGPVESSAPHRGMDSRSRLAFLILILAQAAHSVEEYVAELYIVFAPARFVSSLFSDDLATGFLIANAALVGFGLWCYFARVRPAHRSARLWAWPWVIVEGINGIGHHVFALERGGYFPGVLTAPLLLATSLYLAIRLSRS